MTKLSLQSLARHSVVRHSLVVFAGSMSVNVMAYLYHLLVGRILGPVRYGELSALLSLFYILNTPTLVLQNVVVKFFSVLKAKGTLSEAKSLFLFFTKWMAVCGIIGFFCMVALQNILASFLHIASSEYFLWLYGVFVFYLLGIINLSILQAYQKFFVMMVFANVGGFLRLVLGVMFSYWGVGWTLLSNVFSNVLGYIALFIPLRFLLTAKTKPHSVSFRQTLGYSVPTFLAIAGCTALYTQDVLWVKHFFSPHEAGLYASLSVLGKIIFFASAALASVAFPLIAERKELKKSSSHIVFFTLGIVAFISFGLTGMYVLFPSFIVHLLFGSAFVGAEVFLGLFGLFISLFSLSNLMVTMLLALGKTNVWILPALAALVQGIGLFVYHQTLFSVIQVNVYVTAVLFLILLIYYRYARQ